MDKISEFMLRQSGSFSSTMTRRGDVALPMHTDPKPRTKIQFRALLGHCLYRRVVIWIVLLVVFLTSIIFKPRLTTQSRNVLDIVHGNKVLLGEPLTTSENVVLQNQDNLIIDLPAQEAIYAIQLEDGKADEVEENDQGRPNDAPQNESKDEPSHTAENTLDVTHGKPHEIIAENSPEIILEHISEKPSEEPFENLSDEADKDESSIDVAYQEEYTDEEEESADWPKWLKYQQ